MEHWYVIMPNPLEHLFMNGIRHIYILIIRIV